MALPVLVINRAVDVDRLAQVQQSAERIGLQPTRIDAVNAHRPGFPFALYGDLLRDHFWDSDQIKPGAVGCFLSHRRAWQHVVDQDLPMALICEDDADFRNKTDQLEQLARTLPDFDLIFANGRMAGWCQASGDYDLKPVSHVVRNLVAAGGPKALGLKPTPGGDCYLISQRGAQALLERSAQQGILCGVDWAIVWNGIDTPTAEIQNLLPELGILASRYPVPTPLNMFAIAKPVADQRPCRSVLQHSVSFAITDLVQRNSTLAHTEAVSVVSLGNTQLSFACRSGPDPVMQAHRSGILWDEPGITALLKRFPEGGVFVDIGAHSGNHSVAMAKFGGASRVLAIEPNDEIHRLLQTNMAINGVSDRLNLHPSGTALAGKPGKGWLHRNRKKSSETMVKTDAPNQPSAAQDEVKLITGDAWLADQSVDAIKIDTAGSEVDVVKGLQQTLKKQRPLLLLDHGAQSQERIERLAHEIGYRIIATRPSSRKNRVSTLLQSASR